VSRQKVFGTGQTVPLDRNAKVRIEVLGHARCLQAGCRAARDVLQALLWAFHNSRSGVCFPSYESIAARAGCARSTVARAIKLLEWAGVLSWQHRLARIRERCSDLLGANGWRWRVIRTSNAYVFRDPKAAPGPLSQDPKAAHVGAISSESHGRTGTPNQEVLIPEQQPVQASGGAVMAATETLRRRREAVEAGLLMKKGAAA
jgi:Helix-turn-helix domain